jgi:hypothetical protein
MSVCITSEIITILENARIPFRLDICMQILRITLISWLYKIWGSRGLEDSYCGFLGYDTGL